MTPNDPKRARIGDRSEAKSGPSIMLIGRRHVYNMRRTKTTSHGRCWPQSVSFPRSVLSVLLGDTGFEQHAEMPANTHISETRAAECAAPDVPPEFDASQGHLRP